MDEKLRKELTWEKSDPPAHELRTLAIIGKAVIESVDGVDNEEVLNEIDSERDAEEQLLDLLK